jgi:hypothetical protein
VGESLVLRTVFRTATGDASVTDALAIAPGAGGHDVGLGCRHVLLSRVVGVAGTVAMTSVLAPRMEYRRTEPHLSRVEGGVRAQGGPVRLTSSAPSG